MPRGHAVSLTLPDNSEGQLRWSPGGETEARPLQRRVLSKAPVSSKSVPGLDPGFTEHMGSPGLVGWPG